MYYHYRSPSTYIFTFFTMILGNLVLLAVFQNLEPPGGETITAIQNRMGLVYMWAVNAFFTGVNSSLLVYLTKKKLFRKDNDARLYDEAPFYFSQLLTSLPLDMLMTAVVVVIYYFGMGLNRFPHLVPNMLYTYFFIFVGCYISGQSISGILASLGDQMETIAPLVPLVVLPLMVSSGFMANLQTATFPIRWIAYISPIRFVYQGVALTEFQNRLDYVDTCMTSVTCPGGRCHVKLPPSAQDMCDPLKVLDFMQQDIVVNLYFILGLLVLFRMLGYLIFKVKSSSGRMRYKANQMLRLKFDFQATKARRSSYFDPLANTEMLV